VIGLPYYARSCYTLVVDGVKNYSKHCATHMSVLKTIFCVMNKTSNGIQHNRHYIVHWSGSGSGSGEVWSLKSEVWNDLLTKAYCPYQRVGKGGYNGTYINSDRHTDTHTHIHTHKIPELVGPHSEMQYRYNVVHFDVRFLRIIVFCPR
jgi:hypothetical protein